MRCVFGPPETTRCACNRSSPAGAKAFSNFFSMVAFIRSVSLAFPAALYPLE